MCQLLSKKAVSAIEKYTTLKAEKKGLNIHYFMVRWVLEADRMPRGELYSWLEKKGYKWRSKSGVWSKV